MTPEMQRRIDLIIAYHIDPLDNRSVPNFCKDNEIEQANYYYTMKNHGDFIDSEVKKHTNEILNKLRSLAYKSLAARITKSDIALKLYYQLAGDLIEKSEQKIDYSTPDMKRARLATLLDAIADKTGNTNKKCSNNIDNLSQEQGT